MDVKDTANKAKGLVGEFREFISRGNVVDMAVGIIVGSAFTSIVNSLVKDIITDYTITYLPQVPNYVKGVINLRGQIIPMVDIRLRLGKMPQDDCCIMVVNVDNEPISILVDGVEKMVDVPKGSILPVPTQQSTQKLVSGMCSLPGGGTMLILDCDLLLHG